MDTGIDPGSEAVTLVRHKLDIDEYYRMAEAGILGEDDRVELIGGELIDMAPIGGDHIDLVNGLNRALVLACGERAVVSVQNPVKVDRSNVPQPDFSVFRPRAGGSHRGGAPWPSEVLLLVEVADSSLAFDRKVKLPIYARAGVPELWIVDVKRGVVDAYRAPAGDGYGSVTTYGPGDAVTLAAMPEITLVLDRVFD